MKKVLICAFHLPPFVDSNEMVDSSRPSRFAKYVPDLGGQPLVLTARLPVERVIGEDLRFVNVRCTSFLDLIHVFKIFMPNRVWEEYGRRELTSKPSTVLSEAVHEDI